MAIANPFASPNGHNEKMTLPMPPPLLHTRSGNELYDRPQTPTSNHVVSPLQTPQGSPSKNHFPPGAHDLPNVFDNAMKLQPLSPTKSQPKSPSKGEVDKDPFTDRPSSPTRQSNKENAPGSPTRFGYHANSAAAARDAPYQRTETRRGPQTQRGLTSEELEKLQAPKVRRLANVTQLCK